jgi:uncharacterized membrane protein YhaH (DUF805 family)
MIESVKHNLGNLFNFDGRDARATFWWYVLFLVVVNFVIGMIIAIPMTVSTFTASMQAVQDGADPSSAQILTDDMLASMKTQMWLSGILGLLMAGMLAASFVRRLHDSGKPGWIALIALAFFVANSVSSFINFDSMIETMRSAMAVDDPAQMMAQQSKLYAYSALGWVAYLIIIVFGLFDSERGPNKYGEEPEYD